MQRKFRVSEDIWEAFCASLPAGVSPSDKLREMVQAETANALEQVITAQEAAPMLGVTMRQVQRLCKAGKLECRYADGIWLILKSSVKVGEK